MPECVGSASQGRPLWAFASQKKLPPRMAKVQLELGGKNPAIVLECKDLDGAAQEIVQRLSYAVAKDARRSAA